MVSRTCAATPEFRNRTTFPAYQNSYWDECCNTRARALPIADAPGIWLQFGKRAMKLRAWPAAKVVHGLCQRADGQYGRRLAKSEGWVRAAGLAARFHCRSVPQRSKTYPKLTCTPVNAPRYLRS